MNKKDDSLGIKDQIKARLLQATDAESLKAIREELREEGFATGSIDACVSELRRRGMLRFNTKATGMALTKSLPAEALVEQLKVPDVVSDGGREIFDSGVAYGMRSIIVGIKLAQELSQMGVAQAAPLIKMAQEMRESEGQAARVLASELAEANRAGVDEIKGAVSTLASSVRSSGPNPLESMVAGIAEPILKMFTERMMGMFGMGQPGQGQPHVPTGWSYEKNQEGKGNGE